MKKILPLLTIICNLYQPLQSADHTTTMREKPRLNNPSMTITQAIYRKVFSCCRREKTRARVLPIVAFLVQENDAPIHPIVRTNSSSNRFHSFSDEASSKACDASNVSQFDESNYESNDVSNNDVDLSIQSSRSSSSNKNSFKGNVTNSNMTNFNPQLTWENLANNYSPEEKMKQWVTAQKK